MQMYPEIPPARVYTHRFNGLMVRTGDILCTHDGEENSLFGRLWGMIGMISLGEIDHCAMYVGPGGWVVESGPIGVIAYEMPGETWESLPLYPQRILYDFLVGVAYPLVGLGLSDEAEDDLRLKVAAFCLEQARQHQPYNLNFFDPERDGAFYCSQLIYKAYRTQGIDLNTNQGVPDTPLLGRVVFPQEIWNGCTHLRAG